MTQAASPSPSILTEFHSFTWPHAIVATTCITLMIGASILGCRWNGTPRERRFRIAWVIGIFITQAATIGWWFKLGLDHGTWQDALPLHFCDLVVWAAAFALLTETRWIRVMLYFWGIGLSTQAFFTPVVEEGLADPRFWFFWIQHTQIVGSGIYDVTVRRFRPTGRDFLTGIILNAVYLGIMLPINLWQGWNYGYIGNVTPDVPTIIDRLGPWPFRLLPLIAIVHLIMLIQWLVWPLAARIRRTTT